MVQPKVLVLRTAGTNCDAETAFAFESVGASVERVHINRLLQGERNLRDYQILAIPGGFSYGDDIISGRILANELRLRLGDELKRFITDGKLIIGICNGFQVLVRAGILPGRGNAVAAPEFVQTVTLTHNDSGKFDDRWVYLKPDGKSVWTHGMNDVINLPVAHAEGKFIPSDDTLLKSLIANGQIIFRYCNAEGGKPVYPENPNGAVNDIAGIADETGRILGLMPHPERHFLTTQHPSWTRYPEVKGRGHGARIFENGINYVKKNL
ncbi:MAG: phosphoribosylformylglycinamidine synthase I [Candidatus Omnitrophica bacterium]|nr:phosphoribosylformylglycinamidine synthase I [Candidatus Omnitrophota bacterium]